jgi:hypothetical protein
MGMDAKNNRLAQFVEKLTKHMTTEHKTETQQILIDGAEFQGCMFLSNFKTDDPNLKEQLDLVRWKVHQKTLAARFSDDDILQVVEKVVPDLLTLADMRDKETLTRNLAGLLQSMRDRLEEPGKYTFAPFDAASPLKAS